MEEHKTSPFQILSWVLLFALIALLVFMGYNHTDAKKSADAEKSRVEKALSVKDTTATAESLMGTWAVKVQSGEETTHLTGVIERDTLGGFMLRVLSEYEPRAYSLTLEEDGTIWCDELGEGEMTVKESIGKTTITFKKDNSICTLTK